MSPLLAKVILSSVQDFEVILALSATETYGPMFILSYATSVLYKACFPETVNLMRHCLFYILQFVFFYSNILGVGNQFNMNLHNGCKQLLLSCLANN